jgi:FkbM family methyltransferase
MNREGYELIERCIAFVERITHRRIQVSVARSVGFGAKGNELYLKRCIDKIEQVTGRRIGSFIEIGANLGQDARFVAAYRRIPRDRVIAFEPHPTLFAAVASHGDMVSYPFAVSDADAESVVFRVVEVDSDNSGISTLGVHVENPSSMYRDVSVKSIRMDTFFREHRMKGVDFVKIDVEGFSFQVLDGFGDALSGVGAIQLETESSPVWEGQHTWSDVVTLLTDRGFQLATYELQEDGVQGDSLWVNRDWLNSRIWNSVDKRWVDVP